MRGIFLWEEIELIKSLLSNKYWYIRENVKNVIFTNSLQDTYIGLTILIFLMFTSFLLKINLKEIFKQIRVISVKNKAVVTVVVNL